ncbi:hypothetical protein P775_18905 [Puniceibacterium antarcticum]|uniref:DUF304 domain-containing protein n=1 Tax=Puniceibacterium antarcticum TaxID=1206336 RepID=A0A2G8RAT0_9RHOB|nr:hypothetical protein [Puniceibacterium antarcticum]PIL18642.1 hypothetical protein P775_18905 [Puniceibacterium antarcticum]
MSDTRILAEVGASAYRRVVGVGMLWILGVMLIYIAATTPPTVVWQILLLAMGTCALWLGYAMMRATTVAIELTEHELRDSTGTVLARIADVEKIDRGVFAFKPSNGFTLILKQPQSRCWRPGMWWRLGRRVAVGGVTPGPLTRPMADMIAAMIAGNGPVPGDLTKFD